MNSPLYEQKYWNHPDHYLLSYKRFERGLQVTTLQIDISLSDTVRVISIGSASIVVYFILQVGQSYINITCRSSLLRLHNTPTRDLSWSLSQLGICLARMLCSSSLYHLNKCMKRAHQTKHSWILVIYNRGINRKDGGF